MSTFLESEDILCNFGSKFLQFTRDGFPRDEVIEVKKGQRGADCILLVKNSMVVVAGEVHSHGYVGLEEIVKRVCGNIGYTNVSSTLATKNLRPNVENAAANVFFLYDANTGLTNANASNCRIDFVISYSKAY